jgi:hypothetical protein
MAGEDVPPWHKPGKWVQAGITGMGFPREPIEVPFRGRALYLIPGKAKDENSAFGDLYPVVALEHTGMSFEDGQRLISSFVNSVAWVRRAPVQTAVFGGGSRVHGLGGKDAQAVVDGYFELNYLPDPADEKGRLALAFYREGLTLNSVAYQCLSFFKILNITLANSKAQKDWIDANIAAARKLAPDTRDWEKNAGFDPTKETAGNYLYVSNRCAVAHAFNDPLIDPDDPDDRRRLANDLPMVRALAEHFIEHEFGVKSYMTVWREHLYELHGFKELLGAALVARIQAKEEVPVADFPALPAMSARLAFRNRFVSLEDMTVEVVDCAEGKVNLALNSENGLASVMLVLDFNGERLDFEIFDHLATKDDGSLAGAQAAVDRLRFVDLYLGNGKLEIWSANQRLSRKDAFIPVNVDLRRTHENYEEMIAAAENLLRERGD